MFQTCSNNLKMKRTARYIKRRLTESARRILHELLALNIGRPDTELLSSYA